MWTRTFSQVYPELKKEDIWPLWTDINQWPSWHGDLDYCKLEGAFETPEGLLISNTLVVRGPLQWFWIKLVAQNVADTVPQELEALVKVARAKHG